MRTGKNSSNNISVSKYGIHDLIIDFVNIFKFDTFLFPKKFTLAFVTFCMGIILFHNPTTTYIVDKLAWISHDSLTRLISMVSINNNNALVYLIQTLQAQTSEIGYLIIDDVIIRKPFGKNTDATASVYDHTNRRFIWGMHIVVLLWSNGWIKIPVAFRIWIPKEKCEFYQTKVQLAMNLIESAHQFGLTAEYVTFDTWYSAKALLNLLKKYDYHYVCMLKSNRKVTYKDKLSFNTDTKRLAIFFNKTQYRYYPGTGFYIKAVSVMINGIGNVKMAIVKNGYSATSKDTRFIITDMLDTHAQDIVKKYLCRWDIEVFFRDVKQFLNFEKFQVRGLKKIEGFLSMVFLSFTFVQILQLKNNFNTIGETVNFLQEILQIKIDDVSYTISLSKNDIKSKQVNNDSNVSNTIATTFWYKLSA